MFDKLIESNSDVADFKPRGRYFTVSTVVVGMLFLAAVVVNLYAQDFGLGTDNFEVTELLAPVAPEAPQPPERRRQTTSNAPRPSTNPHRTLSILRIDESSKAPTTISLTPNTVKERPVGQYILGKIDLDPPPSSGTGRSNAESGTSSYVSETEKQVAASEVTKTVPPSIKVVSPANKPPVSIGVVNGKATHLPKPPYSQAALMVGAHGEVGVQVTIDEQGKVISSKAVSGHPLLRGASEKAAWSARFSPTLLSNVPVKVTGVIVYKFTR